MIVYLATYNGLVVCGDDGGWHTLSCGLVGKNVTSVIAREGAILSGTTDGIFRSDDQGQTWREASAGLTLRRVRWLAYHPDSSDAEFAGTEPAGIFTSRNGAETWRECAEVARLRDQFHWSLPYSPEAGCVRGFAFHGARAYAAVEVGGVLRSDDGGSTWRLAGGSSGKPEHAIPPEPRIQSDVHSIVTHPASSDLVFAPTGRGFYRSEDGGMTWRHLYHCYVRAAWIDPADPAHIILGPADSVEVNGRIEETRDSGETWQAASVGLGLPWPRRMVERFTQVGQSLFAVLSNGDLLVTLLPAFEWQPVLPQVPGINAVSGDGHE